MVAGPLAEMMAQHAQAGRVTWIGLRPERRSAMVSVSAVEVGPNGLTCDHGRAGKRAVTLIQSEHLAAVGACLGEAPIAPARLRRNLVVSGLNLSALRGWEVEVGTAILRLTGPCAPCSRMEEELGRGGYNAMRGHGGWCAEVVRPGRVAVGEAVVPLTAPT